MENITIKINGMEVSAPKGSTILEAARLAHIEIPTLCYLKEINEIGACRMCVVEVKGAKSLVVSCVYPINEGMEVWTNTPKVLESRKKTLQLLLSNHNRSCLSCVRSGNCELQQLCKELGVENEDYYDGEKTPSEIDDSAPHMIRDNSKCILCRRCVAVCEKTQGIGVIGANMRGFATFIGSPFDMGLGETSCVSCGQCIAVCPTGALYEKDCTDEVLAAIADPEKHVIVQTAPSVRAALGEEFGYPIGTNVEGKMVAALRRIGFDKVFDTDFAADLTIMEEAHEFLERVKNGGVMEAALRTAVETLTGEELENVDFTEVRGTKGIKEATYHVAGMDVNVAVASGLGNAKELLNRVKTGQAQYHFIEIMGCPGGCVNGGGQPQQPGWVRNTVDIRALRAKVLYDDDKADAIRKSHENPAIKELYATYLGEPGSEKAHHLLHTTYVKRKINEI